MFKVVKKWLPVLLVAVLILAAVFIFFYMRRVIPQVKIAEVSVGEVAASVACSGVVAQESADLSTKFGGTIAWMGVDVGDKVNAGQVLVKLDSYEQAKRDFDSINTLFSQGLASKQQLDVARTNLAAASLVSPIDGVVVKRTLREGEMASPGVTVISIVDLSKTWIDVDIDEIDIGQVKNNEEARTYCDAYPDVTFLGKVYWVSKAAEIKQKISLSSEEEDRIFKSKVSLDNNEGRLKAGMTVDVDIVYEKKGNVVMVPRDAILFRDNTPYVFVIKNNTTRAQNIEIGIKDIVNVEVVKGLQPGSFVAVTALDKLKDRMRVNPTK